jgi:hypothetical protein
MTLQCQKCGKFIGKKPGLCSKCVFKMGRKTIKRNELCRLAFCNSKNLPNIVEVDGKRKQWVGIGWVDCGEPRGTEILVVN